jgi:transcriptional regulator with XRE-family HTH domain
VAKIASDTQDLERHVGQRIRQRRIMLGLTQQEMARLVGITYQQAHKYERGINRVSAGRLYHIATVLHVDLRYFYEELDPDDHPGLSKRERMRLEMARNFSRISDLRKQEALAHLTRVLADKGE